MLDERITVPTDYWLHDKQPLTLAAATRLVDLAAQLDEGEGMLRNAVIRRLHTEGFVLFAARLPWDEEAAVKRRADRAERKRERESEEVT